MRFRPLSARLAWMGLLALTLFARPAAAVTLGQIDDFQNPTVQFPTFRWLGSSVVNLANAGPLGAGDNALEAANGSMGITVFNEVQWKGNFPAAGITQIRMDVQNPNAFDLKLRIGISKGAHPLPMGGGAVYVTAQSQTVLTGGAWQTVTFDVKATDFIAADGNNEENRNAPAALAEVFHMRIIHNPTAGPFTSTGVGKMRLDNIMATGAAPADADFDNDSDVDGVDLLTWQRGVGVGTTPGAGDANVNGIVDGTDLAVWKGEFAGAGAQAAAMAVPEPVGATALGLAALVLLRARAAGRR